MATSIKAKLIKINKHGVLALFIKNNRINNPRSSIKHESAPDPKIVNVSLNSLMATSIKAMMNTSDFFRLNQSCFANCIGLNQSQNIERISMYEHKDF